MQPNPYEAPSPAPPQEPARNVSFGVKMYRIGVLIAALGGVAFFGFYIALVPGHSHSPLVVALPITFTLMLIGIVIGVIGELIWRVGG
jgi:hypothetical protein